jgi:hypothetical protein
MKPIRPWVGVSFAGIMLGLAVTAQTMWLRTAQQGTPTANATSITSTKRTYETLPFGDQRTAWALYAAQEHARAAGNLPSAPHERWSLDDITAMNQNGLGWSQVFDKMKSRGLIQENNLGHVVRKYGRTRQSPAES